MDEDNKCSICLNQIGVEDSAYSLPCSHTYHTDCIVKSLRYDSRCPCCRDTGKEEDNSQTLSVIILGDDEIINTRKDFFKKRSKMTKNRKILKAKRKQWIEKLREHRKIKSINEKICKRFLREFYQKIRPHTKKVKKSSKKVKKYYRAFNNLAKELVDQDYFEFSNDHLQERIRR